MVKKCSITKKKPMSGNKTSELTEDTKKLRKLIVSKSSK